MGSPVRSFAKINAQAGYYGPALFGNSVRSIQFLFNLLTVPIAPFFRILSLLTVGPLNQMPWCLCEDHPCLKAPAERRKVTYFRSTVRSIELPRTTLDRCLEPRSRRSRPGTYQSSPGDHLAEFEHTSPRMKMAFVNLWALPARRFKYPSTTTKSRPVIPAKSLISSSRWVMGPRMPPAGSSKRGPGLSTNIKE